MIDRNVDDDDDDLTHYINDVIELDGRTRQVLKSSEL